MHFEDSNGYLFDIIIILSSDRMAAVFEVPKGKEEAAIKMWEKAAEYMKKQPGFISTKLHKALSPDARFHLINIAEWKSIENFEAAINSDEFKKLTAGAMEEFPHYPEVYEVIRT